MSAGQDDPMTPGADQRGDGASTLRVIACFKLLKAVVLIGAGLGVLGLLDADSHQAIVGWLDALSLREGRRLTSALASKAATLLGTATIGRLVLIAIGCFVYGSVFLVEAVGLWLKKRWAEYLTTIMTASLLPFEAFELFDRPTIARALVLVVNLLVVGYLIHRLVVDRRRAMASKP